MVALMSVAMSACSWFEKDEHITVSESQLYGKWVKQSTQEYWRYNADHSGVTWDESEDVTEEESNLTYEWTVNGDVITHVFHGAQGNQSVPKVYTITEIDASHMTWEDDYGMSYRLVKS